MHIAVNDVVSLTEIRPTDKQAYLTHLAEREIYDRTLRIPFPYTEEHADAWLEHARLENEQPTGPVNFAIRDASGELIGSVGFGDLVVGHRAEIGYWLGRPWWGRDLMTAVVGKACGHAFDKWHLVRVTAHVFDFNRASARVVEKNGFQFEGMLHKFHLKDGRFIDSRLYALVR